MNPMMLTTCSVMTVEDDEVDDMFASDDDDDEVDDMFASSDDSDSEQDEDTEEEVAEEFVPVEEYPEGDDSDDDDDDDIDIDSLFG